jgi:acetyl esterase/lipase
MTKMSVPGSTQDGSATSQRWTPFDPELAAALAMLGDVFPREFTIDDIPALRQNPALRPQTNEELSRDGAFEITERRVPGPVGSPAITLLICQPTDAPTPTAAVYYMHSGGMIMGDTRRGLPQILDWAEELGVAVISVEYRLAPETQHPGPVEDCYAGLAWTAANAIRLGIDPSRIVAVGGSAGGGLAAAVALMARDRRGGPSLAGQMLMCPMLDDRNDTTSAVQLAGMGIWDQSANEVGWTALLGAARGGPEVSPYAAPARASDLSQLPAAFIDVGSAETFRDEAVTYASRIWEAGGTAELHVWPGGFHGFPGLAPQAAVSQNAIAAQRNWLGRILAP